MQSEAKRGVLLVNLGSPSSPTVPDVRRYLHQFLMDPHVIDSPWPLRKLIVSGFILPFRPRQSAEAYRAIWDSAGEGAPLLAHSHRLRDAVAARSGLPTALAMRYGEPDIESGLEALLAEDIEEILLVSLYPHHAASTRSTAIEAARRALVRLGSHVRMRILPPFYEDPGYIGTLAAHCRRYLPDSAELLLLSYHGLPERHITRADPTGEHCLQRDDCCEVASIAHASCYRHQVLRTSALLAERLGLPPQRYRVSFQSRLGRIPWLRPYTDRTLEALPGEGIRRIAVACPAFVADNLETLEEIGIQGRRRFLEAGGESFTLLPCLNDDADWAELLAGWCRAPLAESPIDR